MPLTSDILGIKIANEMVQMAQVKYKEATLHKNEQKNVRCKLGEKRKSAFTKLVSYMKSKKT